MTIFLPTHIHPFDYEPHGSFTADNIIFIVVASVTGLWIGAVIAIVQVVWGMM